MKTTILITAIGACGLFVACAQPGGENSKRKRPTPEKVFERLDANDDGYISYDEFKLPPKRGKKGGAEEESKGDKKQSVFSKIDTDGDGMLSKEEFSSNRPPRPPKGERQ